jgi:uncharacterized protein (TIGR03437 family)
LYPTVLGSAQVSFDGVPGPVLYAATGQINVVVPAGIGYSSTTVVRVTCSSGVVQTLVLPVVPSAPYLFTYPVVSGNPSAAADYAVAWNEDGRLNSDSSPAAAGSVVAVLANGAGYLNPAVADGAVQTGTGSRLVLPVSARVGNEMYSAEVDSATGAAGFVSGVVQIRVRIPQGTVGPAGVRIQVGDGVSPRAMLFVR